VLDETDTPNFSIAASTTFTLTVQVINGSSPGRTRCVVQFRTCPAWISSIPIWRDNVLLANGNGIQSVYLTELPEGFAEVLGGLNRPRV
jgi:hypothetical protein